MAEPVEHPALVAIVLNWRQPELALQACRDLLACGQPMAIFVRDNGSGDDSPGLLARGIDELGADAERVHLEIGEQNLGFAGGVNRGLAWAEARGARFALLVNNDVRVPQGTVTPMVDVLEADPEVGAVGPTVLRPDGKVWAQGGALGMRPNVVRLRDQGAEPAPVTEGPRAVDFLPGAFVLYRVAELRALGGLEESYFMYWEDVDVAMALAARGLRSVWLPWVRVTHAPGSSSGGGRSRLRKFMQAANSVRFVRRHGRPRLWGGLALDVLTAPLAMVVRPRTGWAKLRGIWFGLRGKRLSAADVEPLLR